MKITHVNFARGFRGGERQTLNLMVALQRFGLRQKLVCRTGSMLKQRAQLPGFDVVETRHPLLGHPAIPVAYALCHYPLCAEPFVGQHKMERLDGACLADAIRALLRNTQLRRRLVGDAQRFAQQHSPEGMAREYLGAYHAVRSQQVRSLGWIDV